MKLKLALIATFVFAMFLIPLQTLADTFGPDSWHEYRLNSDKNAVYSSESDPLEYKTLETNDQIRSTPVVAGNKIFVGNHNTGDLYAFNITTGEQLWTNQAPNWVHSEMIYNDGQVFVGYGNRFFKDNGVRGTKESGVLSLDAETGEILWQYETDGEVMPTPAYNDGSLYVTTGDKHLYKMDAESGELLHKEELGSTVSMSSPNIYQESLFVGGSGPEPYTFFSYDLQSDEIKWESTFEDVVAGLDDVPPAIADDIVVTTAIEGSYDDPTHMIYAMNTETGEMVWEESLGKGDMVKNNKSGAPIIYEGKVYVGSPITKTFYAYDLETGEQIWSFEDEVMKAPPVAKDGTVYFTNTVGQVNALDAESGELVGSKELGGTLAPSGPIIINDTLIVGSQDSNVYIVPTSDILESEKETSNSNETSEESEDETNDVASENSNQNLIIYGLVGIAILALVIILVKRKK